MEEKTTTFHGLQFVTSRSDVKVEITPMYVSIEGRRIVSTPMFMMNNPDGTLFVTFIYEHDEKQPDIAAQTLVSLAEAGYIRSFSNVGEPLRDA